MRTLAFLLFLTSAAHAGSIVCVYSVGSRVQLVSIPDRDEDCRKAALERSDWVLTILPLSLFGRQYHTTEDALIIASQAQQLMVDLQEHVDEKAD